jgi:hypothetical protein
VLKISYAVHILENVIVNMVFFITSNSVIAFTDIRFVISSLKQNLNDKIWRARALDKSELMSFKLVKRSFNGIIGLFDFKMFFC